jgi:16S rRNA pseudouridine516 synthase
LLRAGGIGSHVDVKLDRLLAKHNLMGRTQARALILAKRVRVDGQIAMGFDQEVDRFSEVRVDDTVVRGAERRLRLMVNKPLGVVSATKDAEHPTVLDLIDDPDKASLHLVGRLDRFTTGLVLLTNDGRWSKALMHPQRKVPKVYHVTTRDPIEADAPAAFAKGFYFHTEDLTTRPAELEILTSHTTRLTLHEGRYHQVKRMFHRIDNRVTALHRESIGDYVLPTDLAPGEWREIAADVL